MDFRQLDNAGFQGLKVDSGKKKKRSLQRLEAFQASGILEDLHPGNDHISTSVGNLTQLAGKWTL